MKVSHAGYLLYRHPGPCRVTGHQCSFKPVAAVDFQYAGPGCGMRDAAYYPYSLLGKKRGLVQAERWIDVYFRELFEELSRHPKERLTEAVKAE